MEPTVKLASPGLGSTVPPGFAGAQLSATESSGTVGAYEILGELGKGGMGIVYKARQPSLRRLVALKMVLGGGAAEVERLRAEAWAVARLQHPNIVQVYEVGDHQGLPFFSLEYMDGGSLAERIRGKPQPTRQAAALVETLARAMDYAHRQGIVHRDLKPANVLLTTQGMPKIADFGLAKRLGEDGNTRTGAVLGTPSYIAPEQAAGKKNVGPAADIYALGAILYELLGGRPPYRGESPMDTMLQVLAGNLTAPTRLNPLVPRDLETICVKCLEKEPGRRYASAAALADDLRRFLNGESIQARPEGGIERLARWCRRRPLVAGLLAALLVLTLTGIGMVGWQWHRAEAHLQAAQQNLAEATRQREIAEANAARAEAERQRAEWNLGQTRQVVDDFHTTVSDSQLLGVPSLQPLRKQLLDAALRYYQGFLKQKGNDPALRRGLANAYFRVGRITTEIGSRSDALAAFRQSRTLFQELLPAAAADRDLRLDAASVDAAIGRMEKDMGKLDDALHSYQQAENAFEELGADPSDPRARDNLVFVASDLGILYTEMRRPKEAIRAHDKARTLLESLPATPSRQLGLVLCCGNLARLHAGEKRLAEAGTLADRAVALAAQLVGQAGNNAEFRRALAVSYAVRAHIYSLSGDNLQALTALQSALEIAEQLARENPAVWRFQEELAGDLANLGVVHLLLRRPADALAPLQRARQLYEQIAKENPGMPGHSERLAATLGTLGNAYRDAGQSAEAVRHFEQARAAWDALARAHPGNEHFRRQRDWAAAQARSAPPAGK